MAIGVDESGLFVLDYLDEVGNRVFPQDDLNEHGNWVDITIDVEVVGATAITIDTPNAGILVGDNIVNGKSVFFEDTPNPGLIGGNFVFDGVATSTTETANGGSVFIDIEVIGTAVNEISTANARNDYIIIKNGSRATTTESAVSGSIFLPSLIRVGGDRAIVVDQANDGSIGVSELLVQGKHVFTFNAGRKGTALGGQARYIILADKEIYHNVLTGV